MTERLFPVIARDTQGKSINARIPWRLVEAFRHQCEEMCGGQTLERIAERGGMSWRELAHALAGLRMGALVHDDRAHQIMVMGALHLLDRQGDPRGSLKRV
ncbi:hypothetical protein [Sphingomonas sp. MMS24-J13]|uniref:hypothetical protein n=1 Tax=Sphingomonas sp. MMS24-J13 TaxID=3238686 RepID=UPI00384AF578